MANTTNNPSTTYIAKVRFLDEDSMDHLNNYSFLNFMQMYDNNFKKRLYVPFFKELKFTKMFTNIQ